MDDLEFKKLVADTKAQIAENERQFAVYKVKKVLENFAEDFRKLGSSFQWATETINGLTKWEKFKVKLGFRMFLVYKIFPN